ncbi:hypothetical protein BH10ACI2_BH10ACI2_07410 [soil metagenome]
MARSYSWQMPAVFAFVFVFVLVAPAAQAREARSARECFDLGFNLMFIGSVFGSAMALPQKLFMETPPEVGAEIANKAANDAKKGGSACCDSDCCDCCDCCDSCGSCDCESGGSVEKEKDGTVADPSFYCVNRLTPRPPEREISCPGPSAKRLCRIRRRRAFLASPPHRKDNRQAPSPVRSKMRPLIYEDCRPLSAP